MDADPLFFINPDPDQGESGDLHLMSDSPCRNAGLNPGEDFPETDMDGEARIFEEQIDIGADEYNDADSDGLPDYWEGKYSVSQPDADPDEDGLTNYQEYLSHTNPRVVDTDGDGIPDGDEDYDNDSLTNIVETSVYGTSPGTPDTDGDGYTDLDEIFHGSSPTEATATLPGITIHVKPGGSGEFPSGGKEWETALGDLQTALALAVAGDSIWVAEGTYYPSAEYGGVSISDRYKSFQMKNNVAILGGFDPENGATSLESRDWEANPTIISGDIGTLDDSSDNCYHVFYHPEGTGLDNTAILDGFTIRDGNVNGGGGGMLNMASSPTVRNSTFTSNNGAGMYNDESSPILINCTFTGNSASNGGGMYNYSSSPTLTGCTFSGNSASTSGGGMYNNASSPILTHCTFSDNLVTSTEVSVYSYGGAMYNNASSPTLTHCTFSGNSAPKGAGGMYNGDESSPVLTHCTFSGNSATYSGSGGAMYNGSYCSPILTNCTFNSNLASNMGGGMFNGPYGLPGLTHCTFSANKASTGGGIYNNSSTCPILTNCILWGNQAEYKGKNIFTVSNEEINTNADISYSNIEGSHNWNSTFGTNGGHNIDADPLFVRNPDPDRGDLGDLHLKSNSPCINTGNTSAENIPDTDMDGESRIIEEIVDMGTDEFNDANGNGLPDYWEETHDMSNLDADPDGDGLTNYQEYLCGTDQDKADTDGDGTLDGDEDHDNDGLTNIDEILTYKTAPDNPDTDDDGYTDLEELFRNTSPIDDASVPVNITIFVKPGGSTDLSTGGKTWETALGDIQTALTVAAPGDSIWVAKGTYYPSVEHGGTGDRYRSFQMKNHVAVYGGFDPDAGAQAFEDRDFEFNPTILSGDIGTLDDDSDNCYHVMYHPEGTNLDNTAVLDGFVIADGYANGELMFRYGAGVYNYASSPTLTNCIFSGNTASDYGGAAYNEFSSPVLANCSFISNSAQNGGGIYNDEESAPNLTNCSFSGNSAQYGGGIYNGHDSAPSTLTHCTFSGNSASGSGGGMYISAALALTDCAFSNNSASVYGGGIYISSASPTLTRCTFNGNWASTYGGGVYTRYSSLTVTNCTFCGNSTSGHGGAMYNHYYAVPTLSNCIFRNNQADGGGNEIDNYTSAAPVVSYSNIDGSGGSDAWDTTLGTDNGNNIDADPGFTDSDAGDYSLLPDSVCIDAGDPCVAVPENGGWAVDMGAFEYTGTTVTRAVSGSGELVFGGQVKAKVTLADPTVAAITITVHPGTWYSAAENNSVKRWYEISTPEGETVTADLTLTYDDDELGSQTEETLGLWHLSGNTWEGTCGTVDTVENTVHVDEIAVPDNLIISSTFPRDTDQDGLSDMEDPFLWDARYQSDDDRDGIADEWEMELFGDLTTADVSSDYDGDGLTDLAEFLGQTDPVTQITDRITEQITEQMELQIDVLTESAGYLKIGDHDQDGDVDGDDLKNFSTFYGSTNVSVDNDGDGFAEIDGDCDDTNPDINPGAEEISGDGVDNDCDGDME